MIKYVLVIWLITPDNYTDYAEFNTYRECEEKRTQVFKALMQAESKMNVNCRVRYTSESRNNK